MIWEIFYYTSWAIVALMLSSIMLHCIFTAITIQLEKPNKEPKLGDWDYTYGFKVGDILQFPVIGRFSHWIEAGHRAKIIRLTTDTVLFQFLIKPENWPQGCVPLYPVGVLEFCKKIYSEKKKKLTYKDFYLK